MNVSAATMPLIDIPPEGPASESIIIEDPDKESLPLMLSLSREPVPGNDIAYKTIRLKRLLYNKFIRNKPKSLLLEGRSLPDSTWKNIPE